LLWLYPQYIKNGALPIVAKNIMVCGTVEAKYYSFLQVTRFAENHCHMKDLAPNRFCNVANLQK
jgi:hypothetical protein